LTYLTAWNWGYVYSWQAVCPGFVDLASWPALA